MAANGRVSGPGTRSFSFGATQPVVNVGVLQSTGAEASHSLAVNDGSFPRATAVEQNWLSKTVTWRYETGDTGRHAVTWVARYPLGRGFDGGTHSYTSATHLAFASRTGVQVVSRRERIDPGDLAEGSLLAFTARDGVRDMPQLFVLTRRPRISASMTALS